MELDRLRCAALPALLLALPACPAQAAGGELPGSESWQPYLDAAPLDMEAFVSDPLGALRSLLTGGLADTLRASVGGYAQIFLFLLLAALLSLFIEDKRRSLLDLAAAAGGVLLAWGSLAGLAGAVCEKLDAWRLFLLGFVPVYEGVLALGGEPAAAAAAGGLFLSGLCVLAQALCALLPPLLHCYLALSAASCISTGAALSAACRGAGRLFRQGIGWAGAAFGGLMGLQRVFTAQLDSASRQLGQLLTGAVPIVGQSLSDAAGTVLAGVQLLKSGLGFAAIAILGAEFVPLYMVLLLHAALLFGCELLCSAAGIGRCAVLFACLREAVQGLAAATALFFGICVLGTALMFAIGGR